MQFVYNLFDEPLCLIAGQTTQGQVHGPLVRVLASVRNFFVHIADDDFQLAKFVSRSCRHNDSWNCIPDGNFHVLIDRRSVSIEAVDIASAKRATGMAS